MPSCHPTNSIKALKDNFNIILTSRYSYSKCICLLLHGKRRGAMNESFMQRTVSPNPMQTSLQIRRLLDLHKSVGFLQHSNTDSNSGTSLDTALTAVKFTSISRFSGQDVTLSSVISKQGPKLLNILRFIVRLS